MFSRSVAVAALLLLPMTADAQRTNRGRDLYGDWNKPDTAMGRPAPKIAKADLEKFSAVKLIADKKKDLKLSDDQLKQFKDLGKQEDALNDGLYKQVDSLRLAMRRRAGEDGDQERARTTLARQELLTVIRQIRANYDSTFQAGMPFLDEAQKQTATQLVEKEREEAEEDLRSKLGGGGGRRR
ncbi:MAG: hypothetical protein WD825_15070 [Gemmatimonadaceae bacterium]